MFGFRDKDVLKVVRKVLWCPRTLLCDLPFPNKDCDGISEAYKQLIDHSSSSPFIEQKYRRLRNSLGQDFVMAQCGTMD